MEKTISFATDKDGFVSQECPSCSGRFKVQFGEGSDKPISFCPYCSHHGQDCWWTPEQAEYIQQVAQNMATQVIDRELDNMARSINHSGRGNITMTRSARRRGNTPNRPEELDLDLPITEFACCGERVKLFESEAPISCIICGNTDK